MTAWVGLATVLLGLVSLLLKRWLDGAKVRPTVEKSMEIARDAEDQAARFAASLKAGDMAAADRDLSGVLVDLDAVRLSKRGAGKPPA